MDKLKFNVDNNPFSSLTNEELDKTISNVFADFKRFIEARKLQPREKMVDFLNQCDYTIKIVFAWKKCRDVDKGEYEKGKIAFAQLITLTEDGTGKPKTIIIIRIQNILDYCNAYHPKKAEQFAIIMSVQGIMHELLHIITLDEELVRKTARSYVRSVFGV